MDTSTDRSRDTLDSIAGLLGSGVRTGRRLLDVMLAAGSDLMAGPVAAGRAAAGGASGCCCDIPDPCWLPERLPDVASQACPGATARLRLRLTNCGVQTRSIRVGVEGDQAGAVQVEPAVIDLGAFADGVVTATVHVPATDASPLDVRIWIRGCRDHVLRWKVGVSDIGCSTLHELAVSDCPDLVHHWYDHFYCERPCHGGKVAVDG